MFQVIVVSRRNGRARALPVWALTAFFISGVLMSGAAGIAAWQLLSSRTDTGYNAELSRSWSRHLSDQQASLESLKQYTDDHLRALTLKVAQQQAQLVRLEAMGERLVELGSLDSSEFDFQSQPALGGPEQAEGNEAYEAPSISLAIDSLARQIENRAQQLALLEQVMGQQKLSRDTFIAGRPITKGWLSSRYGYRIDPFSGKKAWHSGLDFAGKSGSDIVAVAAGVVTWSGERFGYGQLLEISHGNGYKTRYAHAEKLLVRAGDVIRKGQVVAKMGNTGRSTGPHVHFEVLRNGKTLDPARFITRASR